MHLCEESGPLILPSRLAETGSFLAGGLFKPCRKSYALIDLAEPTSNNFVVTIGSGEETIAAMLFPTVFEARLYEYYTWERNSRGRW